MRFGFKSAFILLAASIYLLTATQSQALLPQATYGWVKYALGMPKPSDCSVARSFQSPEALQTFRESCFGKQQDPRRRNLTDIADAKLKLDEQTDKTYVDMRVQMLLRRAIDQYFDVSDLVYGKPPALNKSLMDLINRFPALYEYYKKRRQQDLALRGKLGNEIQNSRSQNLNSLIHEYKVAAEAVAKLDEKIREAQFHKATANGDRALAASGMGKKYSEELDRLLAARQSITGAYPLFQDPKMNRLLQSPDFYGASGVGDEQMKTFQSGLARVLENIDGHMDHLLKRTSDFSALCKDQDTLFQLFEVRDPEWSAFDDKFSKQHPEFITSSCRMGLRLEGLRGDDAAKMLVEGTGLTLLTFGMGGLIGSGGMLARAAVGGTLLLDAASTGEQVKDAFKQCDAARFAQSEAVTGVRSSLADGVNPESAQNACTMSVAMSMVGIALTGVGAKYTIKQARNPGLTVGKTVEAEGVGVAAAEESRVAGRTRRAVAGTTSEGSANPLHDLSDTQLDNIAERVLPTQERLTTLERRVVSEGRASANPDIRAVAEKISGGNVEIHSLTLEDEYGRKILKECERRGMSQEGCMRVNGWHLFDSQRKKSIIIVNLDNPQNIDTLSTVFHEGAHAVFDDKLLKLTLPAGHPWLSVTDPGKRAAMKSFLSEVHAHMISASFDAGYFTRRGIRCGNNSIACLIDFLQTSPTYRDPQTRELAVQLMLNYDSSTPYSMEKLFQTLRKVKSL